MSEPVHFPPAYRAEQVRRGDPFEAALKAARRKAEDGLLLWRDDVGGDARLGLVIEPADPVAESATLALVAMVGLGDALAALIAPELALGFVWPDRIELNRGLIGGVRIDWAPVAAADEVPRWLVLGYRVALRPKAGDAAPGLTPERTNLLEEGSGDISAPQLAEAFSRHFLLWLHRWQEEGLAPIARLFEARCPGLLLDPLGNATRRAAGGPAELVAALQPAKASA